MTWPVIWPAAGDARNATAEATSAGVPARPFRVSAMRRRLRSSVRRPRKNSLPVVRPGETTLAVIPRRPSSAATSTVHVSTAALAAPYELAPRRAAIELNETIRALAPNRGVRAAVTSTAESRLASRFARHGGGQPRQVILADLVPVEVGVPASVVDQDVHAPGQLRQGGQDRSVMLPVSSVA